MLALYIHIYKRNGDFQRLTAHVSNSSIKALLMQISIDYHMHGTDQLNCDHSNCFDAELELENFEHVLQRRTE